MNRMRRSVFPQDGWGYLGHCTLQDSTASDCEYNYLPGLSLSLLRIVGYPFLVNRVVTCCTVRPIQRPARVCADKCRLPRMSDGKHSRVVPVSLQQRTADLPAVYTTRSVQGLLGVAVFGFVLIFAPVLVVSPLIAFLLRVTKHVTNRIGLL
jgi:hypothetical protein